MPYLGGESGKASIGIDLKENDHIKLTYKSPIFVFEEGTILADKL